MRDVVTLLREWLGVHHTPDAEKEYVDRVLAEQRRRLARIDAGMPRPSSHRHVADRR